MCVCYFNVSITLLFNICKIILDSVFFYTDGVTKLFSRIVDLKKKKAKLKTVKCSSLETWSNTKQYLRMFDQIQLL